MKVTLLLLSGVALATALPQGRNFRSQRQPALQQVFQPQQAPPANIDASDTANIIGEFLPQLTQGLTDNSTSPIDRISKITLAFLPLARQVIVARGKNSNSYDTDKYLKQQQDAEQVVPTIMQTVTQLFKDLPPVQPVKIPEVKIPEFQVPTFDNPNIPDQVLVPEQKIEGNEFVPDIVIPEVRIA